MFPKSVMLAIFVLTLVRNSLSASDATFESVKKACSGKLDFKSIREFQEFMGRLRDIATNPEEHKVDSSLKKCLEDKDALYALDKLVRDYDKSRPCKFSEVAKMEAYARQYYLGKRRPLGMKFFTLFGVNIGFVCKLNLLAHVKQADGEADQLDFIYSMASPTGWTVLINEHTKKSMKFGASSQAGNQVTNRVAKLVPGLNQIDQLDYLSFDHLKNSRVKSDILNRGIESGTHKLESGSREVAGKISGFLEKVIDSCKNLDQFYVNSILSLARLNELGLLVTYTPLANFHETSLMLHKWLAATSFCQLMARVRVLDSGDATIKTEIVHDENLLESRRKLYSYAAEFDEIRQEALDVVWLASVPGGMWRQEDQAMFRADDISVAQIQLRQFIRGLERDYLTMLERTSSE